MILLCLCNSWPGRTVQHDCKIVDCDLKKLKQSCWGRSSRVAPVLSGGYRCIYRCVSPEISHNADFYLHEFPRCLMTFPLSARAPKDISWRCLSLHEFSQISHDIAFNCASPPPPENLSRNVAFYMRVLLDAAFICTSSLGLLVTLHLSAHFQIFSWRRPYLHEFARISRDVAFICAFLLSCSWRCLNLHEFPGISRDVAFNMFNCAFPKDQRFLVISYLFACFPSDFS